MANGEVPDNEVPESGQTHADAPEGINEAGVTEWMANHADRVDGRLHFELITGGRSNLTYKVTDDGGHSWVLRRPPLGQVLATAHDMSREHRIISALAGSDVPVAPTIGLCEDDSVNGAPFYVMDFVDGIIVRDDAAARSLSPEIRRKASRSLVDSLAAIHRIDVDAVGLGDLGRRDQYIERQLKRWFGQFQKSKEQYPAMDLPAVEEIHALLASNVPEPQGTALVHGDYRLDNCMIYEDGSLAAVLDWELCTLGDPLADVGLLKVYWSDPDSAAVLPQASPTSAEGFMRSSEVLKLYEKQSGFDLSGINYYVAFGYWKLTCIMAGVLARYAGGAMGATTDEQVAGFTEIVELLATSAKNAAEDI